MMEEKKHMFQFFSVYKRMVWLFRSFQNFTLRQSNIAMEKRTIYNIL